MKRLIIVVICMTAWIFLSVPVEGASPESATADIQVIKISGRDECAVIKDSGRELRIIKVGDTIGENGKVVEIAEGMVVIEEMTELGTEVLIIRMEDGRQRVERVRRSGKTQPSSLPRSSKNADKSRPEDHFEENRGNGNF
ncbi:MAG: hypothetical protein ACMUIA_06050 [bacterium]